MQAQLADVEQCIAGSPPTRASRLAAVQNPAPGGDPASPAASAAPTIQIDVSYTPAEEVDRHWMTREQRKRREGPPALSIGLLAARFGAAVMRPLYRGCALAGRTAAAGLGGMHRMLETIGEGVIAFSLVVVHTPGRCARCAAGILGHCARVAKRNCRRAISLMQEGVACGSRLLWRPIEILAANSKDFLAFTSRTLRRLGDRMKAVRGRCVASAVGLHRRANDVARECRSAVASGLHRSSQTVLAAGAMSGRWIRARAIDVSARVGAGLRRGRVAVGAAAANVHRGAGAGLRQCRSGGAAFVRRSSHAVLVAGRESWRRMRPRLIDTSSRLGAELGRSRVAISAAAANVCRRAGAGIPQYRSVAASFLRRWSQTVVALGRESWRWMRAML
ncbi:MAG TPA: hypothetical protein VFV70_08940, partial [Hyphomonadaceae bacterium]|nr:hypothetical protein [Hyphomonadaceae bacterium]